MRNHILPTNLIEWPKTAEYESPWPVRLVSGIVFLNGLLAILEVLYNRFPSRLERFLPINYELVSRSAGLLAGFLLIYFSVQLLQRKRMAWWIALVASLIIVAGHMVYARNLAVFVLPGVTLILLLTSEQLFVARSQVSSLAQGWRLWVLSLALAMLYGTLGFMLLAHRDFGHGFGLGESLSRTVREYTLVGNNDLVPRTRQAKGFMDSLDMFGVFSITFAFYSLFRPLAYRYGTLPHERDRARQLLERYGSSSDDFFKLWPEDKSYFFLPGGNSFIAYKVVRSVALCLSDPTGPPEETRRALKEFAAYCRVYGWSVAFIYISPTVAQECEQLGMRSFKIGEDAMVEVANFQAVTVRNKHFRGVVNKFSRNHYQVELLLPPQSPEIMRQLAAVSRSWLRLPGRTERGFALGYFERGYIRLSVVYVLRDKNSRIVAFANQIPGFVPGQASIDLMRHRHGTETGAMDYLFSQIIGILAEQGIQWFNLGLALFSGMEDESDKTLEEWVVHRLYQSDLRFFAFRGLRRYKDKFDPIWQERYLAYQGSPAALAKIGLALNRATKVER